MAEVNRRDPSIYQTEEPAPKSQKIVYQRAYSIDPFMSRLIREYLEDHPPKSAEKVKPDLGAQGRTISDFDYDIKSITTKIEGFIPPVDGSADIGGDTSFLSGLGLDSAAKIFQGGATTNDEIKRAKDSKTHTARGVHAMKASRGIITLISGVTSTLQAGFSLGTLSNVSTAVTKGLSTLKAISGPLGGILLSATLIPRCIELNKMILINDTIKKNGLKGLKELFLKNPGAIELALPEVYKKLKDGEEITVKNVEKISKGLNESIEMTSVRILISSITLLLTILGAVLTSGAAPFIILVVGLVVSLVSGGLDLKVVIDMVKKAVKLTDRDKVIQVITIILAVAAAVVAASFAPTVGLQIAALAVGGLMALIPAGSLIGLSIKVNLLEEKRKKQEAQEDYEKFIARALRRIAEKEFAIFDEDKIQKRVQEQFFLLFKHPLIQKRVAPVDKVEGVREQALIRRLDLMDV